jgi:hypothetical protein
MSEGDLLRALRALINQAVNTRLTFGDENGNVQKVMSYDLAAPLRALINSRDGGGI